jgi:hypothetical protein
MVGYVGDTHALEQMEKSCDQDARSDAPTTVSSRRVQSNVRLKHDAIFDRSFNE